MMNWQTMQGFRRDEALRGRKLNRETMRRVLTWCAPYKRLLIGFILAVVVDAIVMVIPAQLVRVLVDHDDLEPALGQPATVPDGARAAATTNAAGLRLQRARSVASSLDLRGARVEEALEALGRYLDDASLAGLGSVTIIHGLGTGALRDAVRDAVAGHPLVRSARPGERGEGGDGATIVSL